ncbi:DUF945 family protein [Massilia sp. SYSU DXS3249]
MKPALMRRVLAATLFISPFVHAAEQAPKPAAKAPPVMVQAFTAAAHELQNAMEDGADLHKTFDKLVNFQHSPDVAKLLAEGFGNERPWTMEKRGVENGKAAYRWQLNALHQTTPAGSTLQWSEFPIDFWLHKSGKSADYRAAWPLLTFEDKDARLTMRDATLAGTQRRGAGNIWFGSMQGGVASFEIAGKTNPITVALRDMYFAANILERPRTVEMTQAFGIKTMEFAGERVDDFKMNVRIVNIEKAALVALRAAEKKMSAKQVATSDDFAAVMPLLKSMVRGAARHKTALLVDEMSLAFHGHKALLSGRVGIDGSAAAGSADMALLAKRVNARFDIKVPVALMREIALAVARQQAAKAPQAQAQDPVKVAQGIGDAIIGKLLANGYARLENDVLLSTVEFRNGVLRVNGKKIDLPKPAKGPAPAAAANFMQARRITDSCTLPDYPREVVEQNAALELTLQFVVDPAGQLRDLQLAQGSGHAEYDAAVLAAFGGCRFIPALKDGKPVEHALTHTVSREPGSVRP